MSVRYLAAGFLAIAGLGILWRLASGRQSLPCPSWLRWFVELDNPFTTVNRAHTIVGLLGLRPGMRVLDAGCGPGRITIPTARAVAPGLVVALDTQPGMLSRVKAKAGTAGLENIQLREARLGIGQPVGADFDRALLVTVLGEIPDRTAAMRELFAALKPGGILSVTEVVFDPHFQTRATVRRLGAEVGFRERACFGRALAYTLLLERPDGT